MKLVINSEGIYLTKVGECFCVKKDRQKQEIAAWLRDYVLQCGEGMYFGRASSFYRYYAC